MVSIDSRWRNLGNVTPEFWRTRLVSVQSPIAAEWQATYEAAHPHTVLALAMLEVESRYATRFNANVSANRNPLNLRPAAGDGYLAFDTYADAIRSWRERITDPRYKGGIYDKTVTILELIERYAPANDSNDPSAYAAIIAARASAWRTDDGTTVNNDGGNAQVSTPATIDYARLPFPVIVNLIPDTQSNQNPGIPMTPTSGTWHETANTAAGADALMHQRYLTNGADGSQVSWHFTVDDQRAVQHMPLNRVAWHAGDGGNGPGNLTSIAVECCVNSDGDLAKAQENVAALFGLLYANDIIDAVYQHNHWSGKDCPRLLRQGKAMTWSDALALVNKYDDMYSKPDGPVPDPIWWTPGVDVGPVTREAGNGQTKATALAMLGEVTADRTVPIYRNAAMAKGDIIETWTKGTKGKIAGTYLRPNGLGKKPTRVAFVQTSDGGWGRARLSAFSPDWPTT